MTPYMRDISGRFYEIAIDTYGLIKNATDAKTYINDINLYNDFIAGDYTVIVDKQRSKPIFYESPDSDADLLMNDE